MGGAGCIQNDPPLTSSPNYIHTKNIVHSSPHPSHSPAQQRISYTTIYVILTYGTKRRISFFLTFPSSPAIIPIHPSILRSSHSFINSHLLVLSQTSPNRNGVCMYSKRRSPILAPLILSFPRQISTLFNTLKGRNRSPPSYPPSREDSSSVSLFRIESKRRW